jgi:hypothetical protein
VPITIDFSAVPYVIYIPQSYMTFTGTNQAGNPVYDLDMEQVHLDLRGIEASEEYMWCPLTHTHTPEKTIDGVTWVRFVEFQAPYLVELEAFAGVVNARNANHNMQTFLLNTGQPAFNANNSLGYASLPTPGEVADAVWDEARADHTTIGTFGEPRKLTKTTQTPDHWEEL